jgi:DNA-binding IclR family transcriptional regulator
MAMYRETPLRVYGKNTITDVNRLLEALDKVREQGYAIDDEEYYEGVRCVAAPIRAGGRIVASLSITGSIFRMTMKRIDRELKGLVMRKAHEISSEMT